MKVTVLTTEVKEIRTMSGPDELSSVTLGSSQEAELVPLSKYYLLLPSKLL